MRKELLILSVALLIGTLLSGCVTRTIYVSAPTTTPAPAALPPVTPAPAPAPQLVPQLEVTKLVRVVGNKYTNGIFNNNWSTTAAANLGDSLEFMIRIRSTGNTPVLNILAEDTMPGQMNIQQVNGYSYGGAGNTTVWVDSIPYLAVGDSREYIICIILCNSSSQYNCNDNTLQSTVKVRGDGVYKEAITTVTVYKNCGTGYRTPCSSCQYFPPSPPPCTPPCYPPPPPPPPPPPEVGIEFTPPGMPGGISIR